MINLAEQIKLLVELQGIDSHVYRLLDELEAIPKKIREADDRFKEKTVNLKSLEDGVKALQLKRKEKEGELQGKEDSIKKYQSQMFQVKTNKEYSALQEEIARVKADNSLIEEAILKIFDQTDAENKKIADEKEYLKKEEAAMADDKKKLGEETVRIKAEVEKLKAQRAAMALKIDKNVLAQYDRILTKSDHLAVVPVNGNSCQGCFRVLPPQVLNEVRMQEAIITCEYCARILYFEE